MRNVCCLISYCYLTNNTGGMLICKLCRLAGRFEERNICCRFNMYPTQALRALRNRGGYAYVVLGIGLCLSNGIYLRGRKIMPLFGNMF